MNADEIEIDLDEFHEYVDRALHGRTRNELVRAAADLFGRDAIASSRGTLDRTLSLVSVSPFSARWLRSEPHLSASGEPMSLKPMERPKLNALAIVSELLSDIRRDDGVSVVAPGRIELRKRFGQLTKLHIHSWIARLYDAILPKDLPTSGGVQAHADHARFGGSLERGEIRLRKAGRFNATDPCVPALRRRVHVSWDEVDFIDGGKVIAGQYIRIAPPPDVPMGSVGMLVRRPGNGEGDEPLVLLLREFRYPTSWHPEHRWLASLPRGFGDRADASSLAGIKREIFEEAGIAIDSGESFVAEIGSLAPDSGKIVDVVSLTLIIAGPEIQHARPTYDETETNPVEDGWKWHGDARSTHVRCGWFPASIVYRALTGPASYPSRGGGDRTLNITCGFAIAALVKAIPMLASQLGWDATRTLLAGR